MTRLMKTNYLPSDMYTEWVDLSQCFDHRYQYISSKYERRAAEDDQTTIGVPVFQTWSIDAMPTADGRLPGFRCTTTSDATKSSDRPPKPFPISIEKDLIEPWLGFPKPNTIVNCSAINPSGKDTVRVKLSIFDTTESP